MKLTVEIVELTWCALLDSGEQLFDFSATHPTLSPVRQKIADSLEIIG